MTVFPFWLPWRCVQFAENCQEKWRHFGIYRWPESLWHYYFPACRLHLKGLCQVISPPYQATCDCLIAILEMSESLLHSVSPPEEDTDTNACAYARARPPLWVESHTVTPLSSHTHTPAPPQPPSHPPPSYAFSIGELKSCFSWAYYIAGLRHVAPVMPGVSLVYVHQLQL